MGVQEATREVAGLLDPVKLVVAVVMVAEMEGPKVGLKVE